MRTLRIAVGALLSTSVLMVAMAAIANEAPMRITDVRFVDLNDPTQIEVVGTQFDNGGPPVATLDGAPIAVSGSTATLIQAQLPAGTADGDYTIGVRTGPGAKQNVEHTLVVAPLEAMSVVCIDWFMTGGLDQHIHNELHVEDESGEAVIGAYVTYTTAFDGDVFQTNPSATTNTDGHNRGAGCIAPAGGGVTGWFCCIGAGKFDAGGEIPGKRSCPAGEYRVEILSVESPPGTTLVWDGETPEGDTVSFDPLGG